MNKKLCSTVALTAVVAFSAGFVTAADHRDGRINLGLLNALQSVGINLFGDGNFGTSVVGGTPPDDNSPAPDVVQIDLASGYPPDDSIPVYLNVFVPPDPVSPTPVCVASAQIAVTPEGVSVYTEDTGMVMVHYEPLGAPPDPCRDDGNVIGDNPG